MTENQPQKIHERFKQVRKTLKYGQKEFAVKAGIMQSQVSEIESGKRNITPEIKLKLEDNLKVNRQFLETGSGEMFLQSVEKNPYNTHSVNKPENYASNHKSNNFVAEPGVEYNVTKIYGTTGTPIYNGIPAVPGEHENDKGAIVIGYLSVPGTNENSFALQVHGNSMKPSLCNGDTGVLRPISDPTDIEWGHIYYLKYGDYKVWKRLLKDDDDPDMVILFSDNQEETVLDKPKYATKAIRIDRIEHLFLLTDILKKPIA